MPRHRYRLIICALYILASSLDVRCLQSGAIKRCLEEEAGEFHNCVSEGARSGTLVAAYLGIVAWVTLCSWLAITKWV